MARGTAEKAFEGPGIIKLVGKTGSFSNFFQRLAGVNLNEDFPAFIRKCRAEARAEKVELLPYHDLGRGKAAMAGLLEPDWSAMAAPSPELQSAWKQTWNGG